VLDNGRISSVQLLMLLFMVDASTAVIYLPAKITEAAGPDGWFAVSIPTFCYGLLIAGVVLMLAGRFPSQVLTEYLPEVIGRVPGKLLAAIYAAVFINFIFGTLNEGSSFMHTVFMGHTPLMALDIMEAIAAVYGAYLGIEVIARQNQLVWPVWILSLVAVLSLVSGNFNLGNLRPVFENGILPILRGGYFYSPWKGEVAMLLMFFPYLNQKHEAFKTALWALGLLAIAAAVTLAVTLGVFGGPVTAHMTFPYNSLACYIAVGRFIERMNILIVVVWVSGVVVKLALLYHSAGIAVASTLGLKSYRITLAPIAITTVILSKVVFGDAYLKLTGFMFGIWPIYATIIELVIPAIILLVAVIRKKGVGCPGYPAEHPQLPPAPGQSSS
jgi:spore germination protein KB